MLANLHGCRMKINLVTISVWLAAFVPLLVLILAMAIDRRRRKRFEKPPQTEKLLRPPGYSLSIRLDETVDKIVNAMLSACVLCYCAGVSVVLTVQLLAAHAPVLSHKKDRGKCGSSTIGRSAGLVR
jgi:hypothetical protein